MNKKLFSAFLLSGTIAVSCSFSSYAQNIPSSQNETVTVSHKIEYALITDRNNALLDAFDDIEYVYTLSKQYYTWPEDNNRYSQLLFRPDSDYPYGIANYKNSAGLYLKEVRITWANTSSSTTGSLFVCGSNKPFEKVNNIYEALESGSNIIATVPVKPRGTVVSVVPEQGFQYAGIGIENADKDLCVESIVFIWSDELPSGGGSDSGNGDKEDPDNPGNPDDKDNPGGGDDPENPGGEDPENPGGPTDPDAKQISLSWQFDGQPLTGTVHREAEYMKNTTYTVDVEGGDNNAENSFFRQNVSISVKCDKHSSAAGCYGKQNNSVTLFHAGEYQLTASLPDMEGYYASPSSLKTYVGKLTVNLKAENDMIDCAWENAQISASIENPLISDYEGNLADLGINFTLQPYFTEYESLPTRQPASMTDYEWNAFESLTDLQLPFDGYYIDSRTVCETVPEQEGYKLNIRTTSSGLFSLISSCNDENIELNQDEVYINLYPSLENTYVFDNGNEQTILYPRLNGFDIENGILNYPLVQLSDGENFAPAGDLSHSKLELPGLFDATIYYLVSQQSDNKDVRDSGARIGTINIPFGYNLYNRANGINLSELSTSPLSLNLIIMKNDAVCPFDENTKQSSQTILISMAKEESTDTGSVGIVFEDNDEYYDINGYKIDIDKFAKGIYFKKSNGRIYKIIK